MNGYGRSGNMLGLSGPTAMTTVATSEVLDSILLDHLHMFTPPMTIEGLCGSTILLFVLWLISNL